MDTNLLTKSHINATTPKTKDGISQHKLNKFNQYKDEFNFCHKCYRTKIPDLYFNNLTNICNALMKLS